MKRVLISQPTEHITDKDIMYTRLWSARRLRTIGYSIIKILDSSEYYNGCLSKFIDVCDVVYFTRGWQESEGCRLDHELAIRHGLEIIHE